MKLTDYARGQPCTIRLPGCHGGGETTVAAHYTSSRFRGIAQKPDDALAAHACFNCHEIVDYRRRLQGWTRTEIRLAHAEGVLETIAKLRKGGVL